MIADKTLLFTRCATSNASRHFKSPLAMGRDAFKPKHASSVSISGVIDTGVNSNVYLHPTINLFYYSLFYSGKKVPFIRKTEKYCEYNITVSPLIVYLIVMVSPSTRILYLIYREK
jgi:hypothetical protein